MADPRDIHQIFRELAQRELEASIERLKVATQLLPGAMIHWAGHLDSVHQVVFDTTDRKPKILGIEIWNEAAQDVNFVPWHAVELVIPPDSDDE